MLCNKKKPSTEHKSIIFRLNLKTLKEFNIKKLPIYFENLNKSLHLHFINKHNMKNLLIVAFVLFFTNTISAQVVTEEVDPNGPIMTFETETIDYGTIEKASDGKRVFKFTNTGKAPLKIESVKSSCGCTIPSYPKEEIMPGESNEIDVKYNTNKAGRFSKSVSIFTNGSPKRAILRIKGNVVDPNATAPIQKKKSMLSTQ